MNTIYCFGQEDLIEVGFTDNNLKGNIKKIVETKYSSLQYYKSKEKNPEATKHIYTFNIRNLITQIEDFDSSEKPYKTRIATYKNNNLVNISQDFPNKTFTILNSYKYDGSNRLIEKRFLNQIAYYTYNKLGQLVEKDTYYDDKSLKDKVINTYVNNQKKISIYKDYDGKTYFKTEKKYNTSNRETEELDYLSDEKTISSKRYTEYDKYGNITKHTPFYSDVLTVTYFYKYDSKGNWIEKMEFRDGKEEEKTIRAIEY